MAGTPRKARPSGDHWDHVASLVGHTAPVFRLSTTSDERLIASSSQDGTVRLWDRKTAKGVRHWDPSDGSVRELCLLNAGQAVAAAGFTKCTVWSVASGEVVTSVRAKQFSLASDPAGALLAIGTELGDVTLLDAKNFSILGTIRALEGIVSALVVSPDGTFVLAAGDGAVVKINVARLQCDWSATGHDAGKSLRRVLVNGSLGQVISCSYDDTARVWDLQTGRPVAVLHHPDLLTGAAISPDGRFLFTYGNSYQLWASDSWKVLRTAPADVAIEKCLFTRDGNHIVAACGDGSIRWWDSGTGTLVATLKRNAEPLTDMLLCGKDDEIVACGNDPACAIWRRTS